MQGTLIYLMGPSGSGKDSLIDAARESLLAQGCYIAKRIITRSRDAGGEDAEAVSVTEFAALEAQGAFAMSWQANGLAYGIPKQIEAWLNAGHNVLVNGSRAYLPEAQLRFAKVRPILLTVNDEVLRKRLIARGRESIEDIEARLSRNRTLQKPIPGVAILDNSGALTDTVKALLALCA